MFVWVCVLFFKHFFLCNTKFDSNYKYLLITSLRELTKFIGNLGRFSLQGGRHIFVKKKLGRGLFSPPQVFSPRKKVEIFLRRRNVF